MIPRMKLWLHRDWYSLVPIAAGALIQVFLITRPLPILLTNVLPDDAFYYFDVARSVVAGLGSTFNGIDPTNGYHPLWLVILLPIFKWFYAGGADITPVRIVLALSVVFNIATAFFVLRILNRFAARPIIRAYGMAVWMLNPFLLYQMINGLETSLSLLLFSAFFLLCLRIEEGKSGKYWLAGIVGGLMILARIDLCFYVAAFLCWILLRNGLRAGFGNALAAAIPTGIVVSPWIIWNYLNFHMLLTGASDTAAMINHQLIVQDHGPSFAQFLKAVVYQTQYEFNNLLQRTGEFAIAAGVVGAGIALAIDGPLRFPWMRRDWKLVHCMFGGFVTLFIADASIRWTVRDWYFVSFDLFLAIFCAVVVGILFERITHKRLFVVSLIAATLFSFYVDWSKNLQGGMSAQAQMYAATQWMNANLPTGSKIGVFNSGIQEYFSTQTIVNLDGLINNAAYEALRNRSLWQYIQGDHIAYIADFDEYLDYRYQSFWGLRNPFDNLSLVYNVEDATTTARSPSGINIYKVND